MIVRACLRDGGGGSPTALVEETALTEAQRRALPAALGVSHAVFVAAHAGGASLRFFTTEGELPACGHGTVAALAALADRAGAAEYRATLSAGGRTFTGRAVRRGAAFETSFDPGPVALREATAAERALILPAVGLPAGTKACVASVGRPRILIPVTDAAELAALVPDLDGLRGACDRLGLLGSYLYSAPTADGRVAARMFAPSIGVPEDIANANSTACLAAHLAEQGIADLTVDMGDSLGSPASVITTTEPGPAGPLVRVGGIARVPET